MTNAVSFVRGQMVGVIIGTAMRVGQVESVTPSGQVVLRDGSRFSKDGQRINGTPEQRQERIERLTDELVARYEAIDPVFAAARRCERQHRLLAKIDWARVPTDAVNRIWDELRAAGVVVFNWLVSALTLTRITELRSQWGAAKTIDEKAQVAGELQSALSRLMVVIENYPELKANQGFLDLQTQLEGTENRISVARRDYIQAVQRYNTEIRTFPGVIWASLLYRDAKVKENFAAQPGAEQAPRVDFGRKS